MTNEHPTTSNLLSYSSQYAVKLHMHTSKIYTAYSKTIFTCITRTFAIPLVATRRVFSHSFPKYDFNKCANIFLHELLCLSGYQTCGETLPVYVRYTSSEYGFLCKYQNPLYIDDIQWVNNLTYTNVSWSYSECKHISASAV